MMIAKGSEERWVFRPPEERPLRPEGRVIIYVSAEFERYWAEAVRTFTLGDSSFVENQPEELKTLYGTLVDGMNTGKKVSQFYKEIMAKIKRTNFDTIPDYGLGQGIGLSPKELPVIDKEDRSTLKEGMCFSLRLGVRNKETGPTVIGNTVCLSKRGPQMFTQ